MSKLLEQIKALKTTDDRIAWFNQIADKLETQDITDAVRGLMELGRQISIDYQTLSNYASNTNMLKAINNGILDSVEARKEHTEKLYKRLGGGR